MALICIDWCNLTLFFGVFFNKIKRGNMKKFAGIFCAFIMFSLPVYSEQIVEWTSENGLARVEKIGKNLLEKNNLPTQVTFKVIETDEVNAYASGANEICVFTGLLKFVEDDSELAGVIAHEIGHIVNKNSV